MPAMRLCLLFVRFGELGVHCNVALVRALVRRYAGQFQLGRTGTALAPRSRALLRRLFGNFERCLGGRLFAGAATAAAAEDLDAELGHQAFDLEFLAVRGAM